MLGVILLEKVNKKQSQRLFIGIIGFALGMRQLAMTMVMPFLSVYGQTLSYSTPLLAGLALGIFGLMQAIFQIPYGIWSDKKGNKIVMLVGLLQVILGLFLAYFSTSIYTLIIARALQGSGAIIAVGYSWISSNSSDSKERLNAMSIVSIVVSGAAACSFAIGPLLHRFLSVKSMFLYSALLIFIAWCIIALFLKDKKNEVPDNALPPKDALKLLIKDKTFMTLNIGMFINNFVMTGVFFVIPQYLEKLTGLDGMWKVFLPGTLVAVIIVKVGMRNLDNIQSIRFLALSFFVGALSTPFFLNKTYFVSILIGTALFMLSYISIATIIPSLGNFILKEEYRGTGNGIINSLQYVGSFVGSIIIAGVFGKSELLAFVILFVVSLMGGILIRLSVKKERFYEKQDITGGC